MKGRNALRATLILAGVAALLSFSGAAVTYKSRGEVNWRRIGGGSFMLTLAIGAWSKLRADPAA